MATMPLDEPNDAPRLYELIHAGLASSLRQEGSGDAILLSTATIARLLQVSREPVARALAMLAADGLLRPAGRTRFVRPGAGGSTARPVRVDDLDLADPNGLGAVAKPRATWLRVYREAERDVASCLPFGRFRINEAAMALHYGVSRTVTGEVLGRLEERGLLGRDERHQRRAGPLTAAEIANQYELRRLLEASALMTSAPRLDRAWLEAAHGRVVAAEAIAGRVDSAGLTRLEHDLHVSSLAHCGNPRLLAMLANVQVLWIASDHLNAAFPLLRPEQDYLIEHRLILELLLNGSHEAAARALEAHLDRSLARFQRWLEQITSCPRPELPAFLVRLPA